MLGLRCPTPLSLRHYDRIRDDLIAAHDVT
jgi:hypothetical protein